MTEQIESTIQPAGVYLDNAATSFPKPDCVCDAVDHYMPIYAMDPKLIADGILSSTPTMYFSLSKASLPNVPQRNNCDDRSCRDSAVIELDRHDRYWGADQG